MTGRVSRPALNRLLREARGLRRAVERPGRTRSLQGLDLDDVIQAVQGAIDPADADLFRSVLGHVEAAAQTPLRHPLTGGPWRDEDGTPLFDTHFFVYWLWGLEAGSWNLADPLPRTVLEGFNARHGAILWRCEDCLTALANGSRYATCPACGSANLSHKKLSGNEVDGWDPHWIYTPLPRRQRGWGALKGG
jgi:hypothetical protein